MLAEAFQRRDDPEGLSFAYQDIPNLPPEASTEPLCAVVKRIDLTETNIRDLEGLRHFTGLDTLILDKNQLESLLNCPPISTLKTLWFNNNQVSDLPSFMDQVVSKFPNLEYLSVMRNPACAGVGNLSCDMEAIKLYRIYIIYRMPTLKALDWSAIEEDERQIAALRGQYAAVRRAIVDQKASEGHTASPSAVSVGQGIPQTADPKSAFKGKVPGFSDGSKLRTSKNSEGNRFIMNSQL